MKSLLEVRGVTKAYSSHGRRFEALADVSFDLAPARTLAVIGESGAGKSTLARLLCGLERPDAGAITLEGRTLRRPRGVSRTQMVFQNPLESLSPYLSVGASIAEPIRDQPRAARRQRVQELMEAVGMDPARVHERPNRFSGGQLQRIVIARALAPQPSLLICDEPTSALDVSVQAHVINLLLELQQAKRFGCVLVTHDLGVARVLADEIVLLRHGRVVEQVAADAFFAAPTSEYGRELLAAFELDRPQAAPAGRARA